MKEKPTIFWKCWFDPFGDNVDNFNLADNEDEDIEKFYSGEYERIGDEREKNFVETTIVTKHPYKIALTQVGAIPFYENTLPSKLFKFWEGHTNFSISQKVANVIERTEGVETLDIFTKYRARISIGRVFNSREVRQNIQKNIDKLFGTGKK